MAVTEIQVKRALQITLEDEISNSDDVKTYELDRIKEMFGRMIDSLKKEANEGEE